MLNRPANLLSESFSDVDNDRGLDRSPLIRLSILFALLAVPLLAVAGRLVQLQGVRADEFIVGEAPRVTESFRPIETTDGRILVGGTVLARDVAAYQLKLHYRWLEEPVDELWLRRKAWQRLSRADRRDRTKVEALQETILVERERMWTRMAKSLDLTEDEFAAERQKTQARVERIVELVEKNRARRDKDAKAQRQQKRDSRRSGDGVLESGWNTVKDELTTPPKRRRREPIEVREEFDYHVIATGLTFEHIAEIVSRPDLFPGVDYNMVTRREYPQGSFAPHIVGTRQPIDADAVEARRQRFPDGDPLELQPGDRTGRTGVERSYDRLIRGQRGRERIVTSSEGEIIRREIVRHPRAGADIDLALIEPLQRWAEKRIDEAVSTQPVELTPDGIVGASLAPPATGSPTGGCIVAMNVFSGELLCAAAAPRFDLRLLLNPTDEVWKALTSDPRAPMFPRVSQTAIAPGSVFKTLTAIGALESGLDPEATTYCRGYLDRPDRHRCYVYRHWGVGHGEMTLTDAICQSCNVYFFTAGRSMGADALTSWADRMGFGQKTGIDLPGENPGNLPRPPERQAIQLADFQSTSADGPHAPWYPGDTLGLAIGQSRLAVTPLQIVRLMAAVANGGKLVAPRVVRETHSRGDDSGLPTLRPAGESVDTGLSERTLHFVREGLKKVVSSARGTGYRRVRLKEVAIAGKTGTAEVGGGADHAWFAGYAPAVSPQVAFVVLVEHGGSGGRAAGPIAKDLVQQLLAEQLIVPEK